jgi:hypothetical protein
LRPRLLQKQQQQQHPARVQRAILDGPPFPAAHSGSPASRQRPACALTHLCTRRRRRLHRCHDRRIPPAAASREARGPGLEGHPPGPLPRQGGAGSRRRTARLGPGRPPRHDPAAPAHDAGPPPQRWRAHSSPAPLGTPDPLVGRRPAAAATAAPPESGQMYWPPCQPSQRSMPDCR